VATFDGLQCLGNGTSWSSTVCSRTEGNPVRRAPTGFCGPRRTLAPPSDGPRRRRRRDTSRLPSPCAVVGSDVAKEPGGALDAVRPACCLGRLVAAPTFVIRENVAPVVVSRP